MIAKILGDNETAVRARELLQRGGGLAVEHGNVATFTVIEDESIVDPVVDGVDSELERRFVSLLAELTPTGRIILQRGGGNQNDRALVVTVPADEIHREAAALALYRTLAQLFDRRGVIARWLSPLVILLCLAGSAAAQTSGGTVDQGQPGSLPWLVSGTFSPAPPADLTGSGTVTAVTCTTLAVSASGTGMMQLTGVWSGTIALYASLDGTNYFATKLLPSFGNDASGSASANGIYQFIAAGASSIKACSTTWNSGTATVDLRVSQGTGLVSTGRTVLTDVTGSNVLGVPFDLVGGTPLEIQGSVSTTLPYVDAFSTVTPGLSGLSANGYVVNDVATGTVSEDTLAIPRMSPARVPLATVTDDTGNRVATTTTTPGGSDRGLVVRDPATAPFVASGAGGYVRQDSTASIAKESGGNLASVKTNTDSLPTIKTNTDPFVTAAAGGYMRQDSTATMAKETGGNLATVKTNTDPLIAPAAGGYVRQDATASIAKETGGNLATVVTNTAAPQFTPATTTAPSKAELVGGMTRDLTPSYQPLPLAEQGSAVIVLSVTAPQLPLQPCNAVRRTNCQPKGF